MPLLAPPPESAAAPAGASVEASPGRAAPRLWGRTAAEWHDAFWRSLGVRVARSGPPGRPAAGADDVAAARLHLLVGPDDLVLFDPAVLPPARGRRAAGVRLVLRLHDGHAAGGYREYPRVRDGRLLGFRRVYPDHPEARPGPPHTTAVVSDAAVARAWERGEAAALAAGPRGGSRGHAVHTVRAAGRAYAAGVPGREEAFLTDLLAARFAGWTPGPGGGVWTESGEAPAGLTAIGGVWVGRGWDGPATGGRRVVLGPAILWDGGPAAPAAPPPDDAGAVGAEDDAPADGDEAMPTGPLPLRGKRLFDLAFALAALLATLPAWPVAMLLIWLEDGRPFFFVHRRQGRGGRPFGCVKFRTMRRHADAAQVTMRAQDRNHSDGPHFFLRHDPRLLRVGRLLRRLNLDEVPQFLNVLLGHMSVVGPRPSPHRENQFCPRWRDARLRVRPGVTGLWQVRRTRRPGLDFQEWIKYDLEYVEALQRRPGSWWRTDLALIALTARRLVPALRRRRRASSPSVRKSIVPGPATR